MCHFFLSSKIPFRLQAKTERPLCTCLVQLRPTSALQSALFLAVRGGHVAHAPPTLKQKARHEPQPECRCGERTRRSARRWLACSSACGRNGKACTPRLLKLILAIGIRGIWKCIERKNRYFLHGRTKWRQGRASWLRIARPLDRRSRPTSPLPAFATARKKLAQNSLSLAARRPTRHSDCLRGSRCRCLRRTWERSCSLEFQTPARGPKQCQRSTSIARSAGLAVAIWTSTRSGLAQDPDPGGPVAVCSGYERAQGEGTYDSDSGSEAMRIHAKCRAASHGGIAIRWTALYLNFASACTSAQLRNWRVLAAAGLARTVQKLHLGVSLPAPPRFEI